MDLHFVALSCHHLELNRLSSWEMVFCRIEHKTTFTLADNFDNKIKSTGKFPNDWYHYTSLYLRFNIRYHYAVPIINKIQYANPLPIILLQVAQRMIQQPTHRPTPIIRLVCRLLISLHQILKK